MVTLQGMLVPPFHDFLRYLISERLKCGQHCHPTFGLLSGTGVKVKITHGPIQMHKFLSNISSFALSMSGRLLALRPHHGTKWGTITKRETIA